MVQPPFPLPPSPPEQNSRNTPRQISARLYKCKRGATRKKTSPGTFCLGYFANGWPNWSRAGSVGLFLVGKRFSCRQTTTLHGPKTGGGVMIGTGRKCRKGARPDDQEKPKYCSRSLHTLHTLLAAYLFQPPRVRSGAIVGISKPPNKQQGNTMFPYYASSARIRI